MTKTLKSKVIELLAMPKLESLDGSEFDELLAQITNRGKPLVDKQEASRQTLFERDDEPLYRNDSPDRQ